MSKEINGVMFINKSWADERISELENEIKLLELKLANSKARDITIYIQKEGIEQLEKENNELKTNQRSPHYGLFTEKAKRRHDKELNNG